MAVGTNPEYTQAYVNAVMSEFINFKQEKRKGVADKAAGQIGDELARQHADLESKEKELRDYVDQNDMAAWAEQSKEAATYLSDLTKKRARMETELDRMQNLTSEQLLNMPSSDEQSGAADPKAGGMAATPIALDLATQYLQKALELSRMRALFTEQSKVWKPKHPKLIAINDQINTLKGEIEDIKAQNAEQTKVQIGATKAELATLEENIKSWQLKARDAGHKNEAYQQRADAVTRAQALYTQLLGDLKSVQNIKSSGDETIQTLQDASTPETRLAWHGRPPSGRAHRGPRRWGHPPRHPGSDRRPPHLFHGSHEALFGTHRGTDTECLREPHRHRAAAPPFGG